MADSALKTTTALNPRKWIRKHVNPVLFRVSMALSTLASGSMISGCAIETKLEQVPPPDYHGILSGHKLDESCRNIRIENGTTIIPYTYNAKSEFAELSPGGSQNNGEKDPRLVAPAEEKIISDALLNYVPTTCDVRFEKVSDPDKAYLKVFAADLSGYHNEHGGTGASGYANYPSSDGAHLVVDSHILPSNPELISDGQKAYFRHVGVHEVGHVLGLKHGFDVSAQNTTLLYPEEQTLNVSIMNYADGEPGKFGGEIASEAQGRSPQTFQILDQQALVAVYGKPKVTHSTFHNLAALREGWVGTLTASPASDTLAVISSDDRSAFFDMRSGVENVSAWPGWGGDVYSWNTQEMEVAKATNTGNNVFIGGASDNTMIDGSGSSLFVGNPGNDTLYTGGGKDVIIMRAGDGHDAVMDYDPTQDIIEFDGGIAGYGIVKDGQQQRIVFKDRQDHTVASLAVSSPNGELGTIRKAELPPPDHYQTIKPIFKPGADVVRQWNDDFTKPYIEFPEGVKPASVEFSSMGDNSKFTFFDNDRQKIGSMTFRGAHDFYQYHFQTQNEEELRLAVSVKGDLVLPNGVASLGSDGVMTIDTRKVSNRTLDAREDMNTILSAQASLVFTHNNTFAFRVPDDGRKTFVLESGYGVSFLNRFAVGKDGILCNAETNGDRVTAVNLENGQAAILTFNNNMNAKGMGTVIINHCTGSLENLTVKDMSERPVPVEIKKLSQLTPEQQETVARAAKEALKREAGVAKDLRLGSLIDKKEYQNLTYTQPPTGFTTSTTSLPIFKKSGATNTLGG